VLLIVDTGIYAAGAILSAVTPSSRRSTIFAGPGHYADPLVAGDCAGRFPGQNEIT
jgi:hypothetical protein